MQPPISPLTNTSPQAPLTGGSQGTLSQGVLSVSSNASVSLSPTNPVPRTTSPDEPSTTEGTVTPAGDASGSGAGAVFIPGDREGDVPRREPGGEASRVETESPDPGSEASPAPDIPGELAPEEQEQVRELQARDQEVRQHEQAHQVVGGPYTGAANYQLERGPDGQLYAVDGEVPIDTSPVSGDPQATIDKMRIVRAAALAPAEPSPRDLQVALEATQAMLEAQAELRAERQEEAREPLADADSDSRVEAFRDVAATGDPPSMQDSGTLIDAIA